jgi:hypothetical protein
MKRAGIMLRALFCALGFALFSAAPASAHVRSESHSVWEVRGGGVDLIMTIPAIEAQRIVKGNAPPTDDEMKAYLSERVYPLADGKKCAIVPPVEVLAAQVGYRKFDFTFKCDSAKNISLHSGAFFDLIQSHTNFAQVQDADTGEFTEELITHERQDVSVTGAEGSELKRASFLEFIQMGVMHIFTGVDHMSFLVGMVLISRRLRDLIFVVSGFTLGHSLTLALAVTGVLRPHAEYIDALVALTIALIGAENIAVATNKPGLVAGGLGLVMLAMAIGQWLGFGGLPALLVFGAGLFSANYLMVSGHVRDAGRLRMVITLVFGLIHGFGFAANLLELQLPKERLAELLLGFNLGVEIGQLTLVLAVTGLAYLLGRLKIAPPRPIVTEVAAAWLVLIGVYWYVTRSYV